MSTVSTKDRILDAAEILFARDGYHSTSLRTLTQEANANLAAVNYHFGSKEALVEALMKRRLEPLNRQRLECLDEVLAMARKEQRRAHAIDILRAFVEPTLNFSESGTGPRHFIMLIGRILVEPDDSLRSMFLQHIRPLFARFYAALCEAIPEIPARTIYMRLQFIIGVVSHAMCGIERLTGKAREFPLPEGIAPISGSQELCNMILDFVQHGLEDP